ncbi:MAG: 4-alpha-glucanotransferase, partial [Oscillospiraceae bacterium]
MKRSSAILLHISSLASPGGIGTLGEAALRFVDFLSETGVKYWQMLPIGPLGPGNSPYQSVSTRAGNTNFIDLEMLVEHGLLTDAQWKEIDWGANPEAVDYERVEAGRAILLRRAFACAPQSILADADAFTAAQSDWMTDYCLFMALKERYHGAPWWEWPKNLATRNPMAMQEARETLTEEMRFWAFGQFCFFWQFARLRAYAACQGVGFIGDLPIYVSADSVDVWANASLFMLNEKGMPSHVAGVPPDGFSDEGQLWGNPLYNWEAMRADGYRWWIDRMRGTLSLFDLVRIDHFRGFESYWAVAADAKTAQTGQWLQGPGMELFDALTSALGPLPVIAEDLGSLTDAVRALLRETNFPGMKVLQFAFTPGIESDYLPHRLIPNSVVYTGTHDNNTLRGWFDTLDAETAAYCREYLSINAGE